MQAALMLDAGNTLEASLNANIARFCAARALDVDEKAIDLTTALGDEKNPDTVARLNLFRDAPGGPFVFSAITGGTQTQHWRGCGVGRSLISLVFLFTFKSGIRGVKP